jgi:hypothetical protein
MKISPQRWKWIKALSVVVVLAMTGAIACWFVPREDLATLSPLRAVERGDCEATGHSDGYLCAAELLLKQRANRLETIQLETERSTAFYAYLGSFFTAVAALAAIAAVYIGVTAAESQGRVIKYVALAYRHAKKVGTSALKIADQGNKNQLTQSRARITHLGVRVVAQGAGLVAGYRFRNSGPTEAINMSVRLHSLVRSANSSEPITQYTHYDFPHEDIDGGLEFGLKPGPNRYLGDFFPSTDGAASKSTILMYFRFSYRDVFGTARVDEIYLRGEIVIDGREDQPEVELKQLSDGYEAFQAMVAIGTPIDVTSRARSENAALAVR